MIHPAECEPGQWGNGGREAEDTAGGAERGRCTPERSPPPRSPPSAGALRRAPQVRSAPDSTGTGRRSGRCAPPAQPGEGGLQEVRGAAKSRLPLHWLIPSRGEGGGAPGSRLGCGGAGQCFLALACSRGPTFRTCADGKAGALKSNYIHV